MSRFRSPLLDAKSNALLTASPSVSVLDWNVLVEVILRLPAEIFVRRIGAPLH